VRVLHIAPAIFGEGGVFGGGERYALELARNMADEFETVLLTFGPHERRERIGNLELRVIGNPWYVRGQRGNPLALSMLTHLRGFDVVHCHQKHLLTTSLAALACRATRRQVFVTDLGGGGWDVSGYVSTDRWFDGHLHLSEYSRTHFGHADKAFAHVILGGVDTEKFSPGAANAGNDATSTSDGPGGDGPTMASPGADNGDNDAANASDNAVVYAGRLLPHKGINDLIAAIAPGIELKIIGRVTDERFVADLHRMAEGKRITFRHDCDDLELVRAYRGALCVILPSVYRTMYGDETCVPELLGQTLLEGMACGRPVICTRVASMPEIVEDGICGFIVPPNDPGALANRIGWLREHPAEAAAMGVMARQRVLDKFTWPQVVRRCLEIYASARVA
jgi:glycosyltransferase involved in cell wall biosynthesis